MNKPIKKQIPALNSLSKYLAQSGVASRRKAVDLIRSGIVTINDTVIKEPGYKINPGDKIKVDGIAVKTEQKIYILLNKPKDCITTVSDERDRHNVMDLIAESIKTRVYPVGRLDRNTTGVLLLTNDGELALKLSHPRFEVTKVYAVKLNKSLTKKDMNILLDGIELEDGFVKVDDACYQDERAKQQVLVELHSGKYHVVRRLFAALGYEVLKLDRIAYAGLTKTRVAVGEWRYLTHEEVEHLKKY